MMNKRSVWTFPFSILIVLTSATSFAAGTGFSDSFREFILDASAAPVVATASPQISVSVNSAQCMACHDGSGGRRISLKDADSEMRFAGTHNVDHPVGMNYASYASRDPVVYVSPARLDKRIILENGEVTCISCHEIKTPEQVAQESQLEVNQAVSALDDKVVCSATERLTTGTNRTALCLSCHAL